MSGPGVRGSAGRLAVSADGRRPASASWVAPIACLSGRRSRKRVPALTAGWRWRKVMGSVPLASPVQECELTFHFVVGKSEAWHIGRPCGILTRLGIFTN